MSAAEAPMWVANDAGERIESFRSDAEACRWFLDSGRRGDHLVETGEDLADLTYDVLGIHVSFTQAGCVAPPPPDPAQVRDMFKSFGWGVTE